MSANISAASSLTDVGKRVQRGLGERYSDELGLGAVDEMAENPATAVDALSVAPGAAETATPATRDAGDQDAGAHRQTADAAPTSTMVPTAS